MTLPLSYSRQCNKKCRVMSTLPQLVTRRLRLHPVSPSCYASNQGRRHWSLLYGAHDQDRTGDLVLTKDALYRLSYVGQSPVNSAPTAPSSVASHLQLQQVSPPCYGSEEGRCSNLWLRGAVHQWTGEDSNLRSPHGAPDLQSGAFNHSATCPLPASYFSASNSS